LNGTSKTGSDAGFRFYNPENDRSFSADRCFLCGTPLSGEDSQEHVFPKWLQRKFELWSETITLANGTVMPYRQLTIPCCESCNTEHLSKIENSVATALGSGYDGIRGLDEQTLFLWMSKIYYGILFKEVLLPYDRSAPSDDRRILDNDMFEQFATAHIFLQGARVPLVFHEFVPWSLFVFRCQTSGKTRNNFDYKDSLFDTTLGIRMGEVAVVAVLQDNGTLAEHFADYFEPLKDLHLHPIQFVEAFTRISFKQRTLDCTPKYLLMESNDAVEVLAQPLGGLAGGPRYRRWNWEAYAHHLAFHTRLPVEKIFAPPNRAMSWLWREDNTPNRMEDAPEFSSR